MKSSNWTKSKVFLYEAEEITWSFEKVTWGQSAKVYELSPVY